VNVARIRPADAMTGFWGLAMLVFLSLDWYTRPQGGVTGWGAFGVLDKLLALVAVLALLLPVVTAIKETPAWPTAFTVVVPTLAFLISFFLLYRLFDQPGLDRDVAVDAGAWLGCFALLGIFVSALLAQRDERAPGLPEPTEIPVMPAPPRDAPGSSPTEEPA
jgi:peptidoglycan/LPS O-acetylase OafA/YrhL